MKTLLILLAITTAFASAAMIALSYALADHGIAVLVPALIFGPILFNATAVAYKAVTTL